jgi:hypothetical protein
MKAKMPLTPPGVLLFCCVAAYWIGWWMAEVLLP